MKITNQYEEAEAIYPVTGLYIDPDGNAVEKSEMLLSEHRMDVYINDVLTMKLVCTPKDLPGLVLGRMVSEGMIHSSEEVEYNLYVPGRSLSIASRLPPGNRRRPSLTSTVTPGKFPVFCRNPVNWLKMVDFPLLGFPTSAMFRNFSPASLILPIKYWLLLPRARPARYHRP